MNWIRPLLKDLDIQDVPQALLLVRSVFMEYSAPSYGKRGLEPFLSFITEDNLKEQMLKHGMRMFGAYAGDRCCACSRLPARI